MVNKTVITLMRKEVKESISGRWFIFYTASFASLSLLMSLLSLVGAEVVGLSGFSRTTAGLINIILFLIPLMGLMVGAQCIAGERESGTLTYLLSQPLTRGELYAGKYAGSAISLFLSITLGFGLAGTVISLMKGRADIISYLNLIAISLLLGMAMLSVGFLISSLSKTRGKTMGAALAVWLSFTVLSDLGIIGTSVAMKLGAKQVFALAIINPVEVFKLLAVMNLNPQMEVLGPSGMYAVNHYGSSGTLLLLTGLLLLWTVLPNIIGYLAFRSADIAN